MSVTSLALIVGLGGRLLLDQLTRTGAAPTTREFVVLGLWMGSGLHYVSTSSRELLVPAGAVVGVKLFSDFVFQESARVLICVLGIGLGFCFADLVSRWMEGGGESSRPSSRARERDRDKEKRDAQRRVSSRTRRSEGDERRSPRRQSSRRAVSDITSVDANSFAYERDSATMRTPLDREIAALRARASLADSERRRYKEERKWALDDGNEARAKEMSWQYKRYSALMKSFHREADELQMSVASGARPERPLDDSMLLPTEVAEQVIDACDGSDTRTLASCTLVCRSWHNRAAFRLFARPLRVVGIPDLEAFVATLRSPICTIHDLIRSLSVQQSSRNPSLLNHVVPVLVELLVNLTSLEILAEHAWLSDAALEALRNGFRSLRHLSLHVTFATSEDCAALLCSFPQLETLDFGARWIGSSAPPTSQLPPTLHTLALDGFMDDALLWLLSFPPNPAITSVEFRDVANREPILIIRYLRHVAATVRVFKVSFIDTRAETHFLDHQFDAIVLPRLHTLELRGYYDMDAQLVVHMLARISAPELEVVALNMLQSARADAWTQLNTMLQRYPKAPQGVGADAAASPAPR
ncbi:ATP-dependent DNA helicase [Mycena kentingensis (nom. inval.)]|nr:ATP-dependent DNA helicase [Mycena kentingensis (nom. inval.)]